MVAIGDVKISSSLLLKNVLHVPRLTTNFVSIQKLTKDLHCKVVFNHSYCVFQYKYSGRTIGHTRERDGLYYLETPSQSNTTKGITSHSPVSESFSSNKEKVWLHHRRLGYPSFRIIKILFPPLFKDLSVEHFHCEVCELAKHKRISFLISNKRSSIPFDLIHSDIWGPSTISNVNVAKMVCVIH